MSKLVVKPPVVVVLGHVDHGKTTLLDVIRSSAIVKGEFGGITQHIGAYEIITKENKKITFIDTPGHEAFPNMRIRGARLADIALLVVAADDSVQPQTKEALAVIKKNKIPFIVVINKIDLPEVRVEKVIKDLAKNEVYLEGRGGETPMVQISAKNKTNIDNLLELITLLAEINNLTYSSDNKARGVVLESKKDNRGIILTTVLTDGKLRVGDDVYIDEELIRIRAMFDDLGKPVTEIEPSTPVEILGSKKMVVAGTLISQEKEDKAEEVKVKPQSADFNDFFKQSATKFNFVIKADSYGMVEAITAKFNNFEEILIVKSDIGDLNDTDVELAKSTNSNVLLFNVKLKKSIAKKAELEGINIFNYNLIYELLDQVEDLIYALRIKREKEARKVGECKILAKFNKEEQVIAGMNVLTGRIALKDKAEIIRGKKPLGETTIGSLNQKSSQTMEVKKGEQCGAIFNPILDFQQGDIVKLYTP